MRPRTLQCSTMDFLSPSEFHRAIALTDFSISLVACMLRHKSTFPSISWVSVVCWNTLVTSRLLAAVCRQGQWHSVMVVQSFIAWRKGDERAAPYFPNESVLHTWHCEGHGFLPEIHRLVNPFFSNVVFERDGWRWCRSRNTHVRKRRNVCWHGRKWSLEILTISLLTFSCRKALLIRRAVLGLVVN